MAAKVVCISRTLAAGGEEVGQGVAERLGYRVIDAEIIQRAAEKADLKPERVAQTEQRQSLIRRLISSIAFAEPSGVLAPEYYAVYPEAALAVGQTLEERLRLLIREVIEEVANEGQAVIVAHAASMALSAREGVLRILVTASDEERAERLVWAAGMELGPPRRRSATRTASAPTISAASTRSTRNCRRTTTSSSTPTRWVRSRPST